MSCKGCDHLSREAQGASCTLCLWLGQCARPALEGVVDRQLAPFEVEVLHTLMVQVGSYSLWPNSPARIGPEETGDGERPDASSGRVDKPDARVDAALRFVPVTRS
jgi:hypothetical protein